MSEGEGGGGTIDIGAIITMASTATLTEHPATFVLLAYEITTPKLFKTK